MTGPKPLCDHFAITPADREREWMSGTPNRFAYRCLPLVIANQMGWMIGSPVSFEAMWDGSAAPEGVHIRFDQDAPGGIPWNEFVVPHFGSGILTFQIPYLFRTDPGYGLLVRGPTNTIKRGAIALDAYVETDWHDFTFTMNWKLTDPMLCVRFKRGEPMCLIMPYNALALENTTAELIAIVENAPLRDALHSKAESRSQFLANPNRGNEWQKTYFQGENAAGERQRDHLSKLKLPSFQELGLPE